MATTTQFSLQTIKNIIWVFLGISCLLLALIFMISQSKKVVEVVEVEQQAQDAARPVQSEKVAMGVSLGTLTQEVPPLMLKQREAIIGDHEPEFRGSKFLSDHKKNSTLQVMQVEEEDVIRTYLNKREDRNQFQYFRLEREGQATKFVLTYGNFKDSNQLKNHMNSVDLQLPTSVKPTIVSFSSYEDLVNDLGTDEVSSGLKLRPVNLTKAALPVLPARPTNTLQSPTVTGGTTTTVRQTDPNTKQEKIKTETSQVTPSQSSPQEQKPPTSRQQQDTQVVDPF